MGDEAPQPPSKLDVARALLAEGTLFIHLDPRPQDVIVPPWFKHQPQLVLQVGLQMAVPIPDLRVDEQGVLATLSFNRSPFTCYVPWSAAFALVGDEGRGMVWQESMPEEIAAEVEREAERMRAKKAPQPDPGVEELHERRRSRPPRPSEPAAPGMRRATPHAAKKHQPSTERVPRKLSQPPSRPSAPRFEVISGEGEQSHAPRHSEVNGLRPAHLKLVK